MSTYKPHQHPEQPALFQQINLKNSTINFPTDLNSILERVSSINPSQYAKTRNFINGAVTYLSPYISRGFLQLTTIQQLILQQYKPYQAEKLLQELAWREYFQRIAQYYGEGILQDVKQLQQKVKHYKIPINIFNANTGITGIDEAINILYNTGYMHNHARMYTAMLTCNIAQSHWLKPAQWLYYHLLDGDFASNHLSWQWVAGSFSSKKYYANQDNINKYTGALQKGSYLDVDYGEFETLSIPNQLLELVELNLKTELPSTNQPNINPTIPTLVYNSYNIDYLWHEGVEANRIFLLEPAHFTAYPVSQKILQWMFDLATANIPNIQIFTGSFEQLQAIAQNSPIHFKEHPLNNHYKGIMESRSWLYPEVKGNFNSFFAYWKKCERFLRY